MRRAAGPRCLPLQAMGSIEPSRAGLPVRMTFSQNTQLTKQVL